MTPQARIVFVSHTAEVGGAESVMLALVDEALTEGSAVTVACPVGELSNRIPSAATHLAIPGLGLHGESGVDRLRAAVVLMYRWVTVGVRLRRVVRRPSTSTVVNSLFALPALRIASPRGGARWLIHDTIAAARQRAVVKVCRSVIVKAVAVSEPTAQAARPLGVPVVVRPLGVFVPERVREPLDRDRTVIGTMGVITEWKGHHVLLEAISMLPNVDLEIAGRPFAGDTAYAAALEARSKQPDLDGRVRFLGHVDARSTMAEWNVLVSASIEPEAGPLVALEAMSIGVPVVGTDHGGTRVLLSDQCGVLVAPNDARALARGIDEAMRPGPDQQNRVERARAKIESTYDRKTNIPAMLSELISK